jgi:hypothetical protein
LPDLTPTPHFNSQFINRLGGLRLAFCWSIASTQTLELDNTSNYDRAGNTSFASAFSCILVTQLKC